MYAEVILSQRFPKHLGIFDYTIPPSLEHRIVSGSMVRIPFRSQTREGIVIRLKKRGIEGKHIKSIIDVITNTAVLSKEQITLADWMAQYYSISLGTIVKSMLPPLPPQRHSVSKKLIIIPRPVPTMPLSPALTRALASRESTLLIMPQSYKEYQSLYCKIFSEKKGLQLIIVPTREKINELLSMLPADRHDDCIVVHGLLSNNELFRIWEQIKNNSNAIIIGTKSAIFLPLHSLHRIIIDEEENQNHKQADQNPRYDVRTLAEKCRDIYQTQLVFVSPAPQVAAFYQTPRSDHFYLKNSERRPAPIELVDMRDERKRKNYSMLSEKLEESISQSLSSHCKILLIINKRGSANAMMCQDCGTTLRCPVCSNAYTYHEKSQELYCHHCLKRAEIPPFCSTCRGTNLKTVGYGTQSVETHIKKKFPLARVVRVDADSEILEDTKGIDILIGTSSTARLIPNFTPTLIGIIDADTFLYLPDYRAVERTWQFIKSLIQYPATCIIQTYNHEHFVFQKIINHADNEFYTTELEARKKLGYPPFGSLIKLIYKHRDKKVALSEAQRLYRQLNQLPLSVSLVTPLKPYQHAFWQMYVVIRFDTDAPHPVVDTVLNAIPDNWIIDRDPSSLL